MILCQFIQHYQLEIQHYILNGEKTESLNYFSINPSVATFFKYKTKMTKQKF